MKPCNCGSGLPRRELLDARGIFCTFICDKCEKRKRAGFRPDVLADPNYWHDEPIEEDYLMPAPQKVVINQLLDALKEMLEAQICDSHDRGCAVCDKAKAAIRAGTQWLEGEISE